MGDGFAADPNAMLAYAGQLGGYGSSIGVADDAANTSINENSRKLGPVTNELRKLGVDKTGQLDGAYGVICQPYGIELQNMQTKAAAGIKDVLQLMTKLASNLRECAKNYAEVDHKEAVEIKKIGSGLDRSNGTGKAVR